MVTPAAFTASAAARKNVEMARELVAALVGSRARDVVFTGSGTEANNQVLKAWPDRQLFVSAIEHDSVRDVETHRQSQLPVGSDGQLDVAASVQMIAAHGEPCVVALMLVNNETGIKQPVAALTKALKSLGRSDIHVHCDAVQAAGKMWIDMVALDVDTMSLSAHKIGGPQGVGPSYIALVWHCRGCLMVAVKSAGCVLALKTWPALLPLAPQLNKACFSLTR